MAKRGPSASIALEVARVQLASLLKVPGLLALPHRVSEEPETGMQKGARKGWGWRTRRRARLCYHCPSGGRAECKSASITYKLLPQAAAIEHLLTHFNIDPKEIPTFLLFFF